MKFTDIHHHLLYGVDDGAKDQKQMYEMLEHAAADNIGCIVCTSHISPGMEPFNYRQYNISFREAQEYCTEHGLDIELLPGSEIFYTSMTPTMLQQDRVPTLAGTDSLLVEFSPADSFDTIEKAVGRLQSQGYRTVIAHVERYRSMVMFPARAEQLRINYNVRFQVNCSTIISKSNGLLVSRFLKRMFESDCIDAVATDAHNLSTRRACMKAAYQELQKRYGEEAAEWLTSGRAMLSEY